MRKSPPKKRPSIRPRSGVDPTRVALAALERIRTVLVKSGHPERLGHPLPMKELAQQSQALGTELPPSYVAAMRVASRIGEPESLLDAAAMLDEAARMLGIGAALGDEAKRYAPFCRTPEGLVCFDKGIARTATDGELPVVAWRDDAGTPSPVAATFGDWLDLVADAREAAVEDAADMPERLRRLLYELGFRFDYPVVGRLETGDTEAIEELIGREVAHEVRSNLDRLFDSSGKAALTLNVDEFTLHVVLRTGMRTYQAPDVFRWLRHFRDENFFGEQAKEPEHPDYVRDLRRAPREPAIVQRGVTFVPLMSAQRHAFRAASGISATDFYLLGRSLEASETAPSLILHVVEGVVASQYRVEEPLDDLYVARDGTMWGLTVSHAVRFSGGRVQSFPLNRPSPEGAAPAWKGIGGGGDRVLVWGSGALLEFDGRGFVPFDPDASLDPSEDVLALAAQGLRIAMLVTGDALGAVARFDGTAWTPIGEDEVIDQPLRDLDWWRDTAYVLDVHQGLWHVGEGRPRVTALPAHKPAFLDDAGAPRPVHGVRAFDGGVLLATRGGVIELGSAEPVFHSVHAGHPSRDPVRLVRVAPRSHAETLASPGDVGIVALSGPNVWVWSNVDPGGAAGGVRTFQVIDMREW